MNEYFRYLVDDDATRFFEKVAREEAELVVTRAADQSATETRASTRSMETTINRDLGILKAAGSAGMSLGTVHRADVYFDRLVQDGQIPPDSHGAVFDKIAGEAIQADIEAARAHLYSLADEDQRHWIDAELAKVALDLVKAAQVEKQAIIGAIGRLGLRGATSGAMSAIGAGTKAGLQAAGRAATTGVQAAGRAATAPFRAAANLGREGLLKFRTARSVRAGEKLKGIERRLGAAQAMKPGAFQSGAMRSLEKQRTGAQAGLAKREAAFQRSVPKAPAAAAPATAALKAPATAPPPAPTSAATTAPAKAKPPSKPAKAKQAPIADEAPPALMGALAPAGASAKAPKAVKTKKKGRAEAAEEAAEAAKPKFREVYTKLRDQGWKSLSGEEKQKLINAGALGLVGGRLVTGHGLITGGEGLI
jgi:hypothetical protein